MKRGRVQRWTEIMGWCHAMDGLIVQVLAGNSRSTDMPGLDEFGECGSMAMCECTVVNECGGKSLPFQCNQVA